MECWQLYGKTRKHNKFYTADLIFVILCIIWTTGENVIQFQRSTCVAFPIT